MYTTQFIIYPEAMPKLNACDAEIKIKDADIPYFGGSIMDDDLEIKMEFLTKGGYFDAFESLEPGFKNKIKSLNKNNTWKINKTEKIEPTLEHLIMLMGDYTSYLFKPEEIANLSKWGFTSVSEFNGTIAVYMIQKQKRFERTGQRWEANHNGKKLLNEIGGNMHSDLLIMQMDITNYETIDPMGNRVYYRPTIGIRSVPAGHSVEGELLANVLQYITQTGIRPSLLNDNAKSLLEEVSSWQQHGGTCTEHSGGFDQNPEIFFAITSMKIPKLKNWKKERSRHNIFSGPGNNNYEIYIGKNKELVIGHEQKGKFVENVRYIPEEMDYFLKGLFYQAASGIGRTSLKQLIGIVTFRFSDEFENFKKKFNIKD